MKFLNNVPTERLATPSTDAFFKNLDYTQKFQPPKIEPVENEADEVLEKVTDDTHYALQHFIRIPCEDYFKAITSVPCSAPLKWKW